jgi:hypothetical protein
MSDKYKAMSTKNVDLTQVSDLTPQILRDKGFSYIPRTISGADQWQGVPIWKRGNIELLGGISTDKGGVLYVCWNDKIQIRTTKQLDSFLELCVD